MKNKHGIGTKFKYLTITEILEIKPYKKVKCRCICGVEKEFYLSNIIPRKGHTRYTISCGCKRGEIVSQKNSIHKMSGNRFWRIWSSMKWRTSGKSKQKNIKCYLGKNIEWKNMKEFKKDMYNSYLEHVKLYGEKNTTIDRIDNNKGYSKENCRWATLEEQANNKGRITLYNYKGENLSISQWSRKLFGNLNGIGTFYLRAKKGWSIDKILETPIKQCKYNKHYKQL